MKVDPVKSGFLRRVRGVEKVLGPHAVAWGMRPVDLRYMLKRGTWTRDCQVSLATLEARVTRKREPTRKG